MVRSWRTMLGVAMAVAASGIADAQTATADNVITRLQACRVVADTSGRLACFDAAAASIDQAVNRHELVILDKQEVKKTSRSLFGFQLPNLKLLTGTSGELDVKELDVKVTRTRPVSYQKYDIDVEGGGVWRNVDLMPEPPQVGDTIHLNKGLAGSFFMKAPGLQPVRAGRVR